jgi:clan AA aspartic protease
MMTGIVRDSEARIRMKVRGPGGRIAAVNAVVDTGYTGYLTLPRKLIRKLGLLQEGSSWCILADGSSHDYDCFKAIIEWDNELREFQIDEADTEPLLGMALLDGYELNVKVRSGGRVTITKLTQPSGASPP